jgi:ParB family chromosome partitioning protein
MARKDLLRGVLGVASEDVSTESRAGYAMRGASKSMKVSIGSLAEASRMIQEGETIIEIDPGLIDASFVNDRLTGDDEAFEALKGSIAAGRQDTPVLLRPHPTASGRYMTVFGHRRVRAAAQLGRKVRAVVKPLDDLAHVLAQGQENTARADLSFIEKALFAKKLLDLGQAREVIQAALTVDATLLSRLLSVSSSVPRGVIEAIGPAKQIGRDRWEDFKKRIAVVEDIEQIEALTRTAGFLALDSDARFELLHGKLPDLDKPRKRPIQAGQPAARARPEKRTWAANGGRIKGVIGRSGKAYTISLTSKDSAEFGAYLAANLDRLYETYLSSREEDET